eukprot:2926359-Rhodomonas_salina.1
MAEEVDGEEGDGHEGYLLPPYPRISTSLLMALRAGRYRRISTSRTIVLCVGGSGATVSLSIDLVRVRRTGDSV